MTKFLHAILSLDMANMAGNIHGGCSAFLIDMYVFFFQYVCSSIGKKKASN